MEDYWYESLKNLINSNLLEGAPNTEFVIK